ALTGGTSRVGRGWVLSPAYRAATRGTGRFDNRQLRDRRDQLFCVSVLWTEEYPVDGIALHNFPVMQNRHSMAKRRHRSQIVRNIKDRDSPTPVQPLKQPEN